MSGVLDRTGLPASLRFWSVAMLLLACFALGGSARADVPHLMVLRPVAILLLGYGLATLRWHHLKRNPWAWLMAAALVALPAIHLVPLPPELWQALPGREIVAEVDAKAGLGSVWRPLTLAPLETRNAFFASLVPLAGFVLGMQLGARERRALLPIVLTLAAASALAGVMQLVAGAGSWTRLYPITNADSEVGLFANRNHQASLLAMALPMLAVAGYRGAAPERLLALTGGAFVIVLALLTGSRSGMLALAAALVGVPAVLHGMSRQTADRDRAGPIASWPTRLSRGPVVTAAILVSGLLVAGLAISLGRATAWDRFVSADAGVEQRFAVWPTLGEMMNATFPVGGGIGSFQRLFQVHEQTSQLSSLVLNHAHNDWFEFVLDGGLPAAIILLAVVFAFGGRALQAWPGRGISRDRLIFARLGLVLVGLAALVSLFDYPMRTPIMAMVIVVAALWILGPDDQFDETKLLDSRLNINHRKPLAAGIG